ncbi:MAG: phage terminase large subunit [Bacillota bacterium]|jgi:phage terminase large subunit
MTELKFDFSEPQKRFMKAKETYVLYGGARGGGKSWSLRVKLLLLALKYPGISMLLLRRTFPELRENHIIPMQKLYHGLANYKVSDKVFEFFNGSRLVLGYCATDTDTAQYQGQEYDIICFDEATQFSEQVFFDLTACLRGTNDFPKRVYLTANPGGVGHAWVKRLFIDRDYRASEDPDDYVFIPARVYDNPHLMASSPGYVKRLENLPDNIREAWLNGDWNVFSGQYFTMWRNEIHVVEPFAVPDWWERYSTMDYGRDMFAAYDIAVDEKGRAYVVDEIYQSGLWVDEAAELFNAKWGKRNFSVCYAPPDLWNMHNDTGRSTFEMFANHGIYLYKAKNDRIQGWYDLADWLQPRKDSEGEYANLRIFKNCKNLIRCLPMVQCDEKKVNDVATEPHELTHSPDAIRYWCAGRPYPSALPTDKGERRYIDDEDDGNMGDFLSFGRR